MLCVSEPALCTVKTLNLGTPSFLMCGLNYFIELAILSPPCVPLLTVNDSSTEKPDGDETITNPTAAELAAP